MKKEILEKLSVITEEEQAILDGSLGIDCDIYMQRESSIINARKLMGKDELISIRPGTRFAHFPKHTHDYIEIAYMCKGKTSHIINGKDVELLCGETLILNQHAVQEVFPIGKDDLIVNVIVLPQFFNKALEMMGAKETPFRRFIIDCITGKESSNGYLHLKTANIQEIHNLFENLIISFVEKKNDKREINEYLLGILLLEFTNNSEILDFENGEKNTVLEVLRYIESDYIDGTLSKFAKQSHYDFHWISRELKQKTGKTFTAHMQEKRLSQAGFLLRTTKMRVSDISASVGYNNFNFFYKIFNEHYGMSPKKYRDSIKQ